MESLKLQETGTIAAALEVKICPSVWLDYWNMLAGSVGWVVRQSYSSATGVWCCDYFLAGLLNWYQNHQSTRRLIFFRCLWSSFWSNFLKKCSFSLNNQTTFHLHPCQSSCHRPTPGQDPGMVFPLWAEVPTSTFFYSLCMSLLDKYYLFPTLISH